MNLRLQFGCCSLLTILHLQLLQSFEPVISFVFCRGYASNIQGINYSNVERWTLPQRLLQSTGSDTCILEKVLILIPVHVSANGTGSPNHWIDVQLDLNMRTSYCLDTSSDDCGVFCMMFLSQLGQQELVERVHEINTGCRFL